MSLRVKCCKEVTRYPVGPSPKRGGIEKGLEETRNGLEQKIEMITSPGRDHDMSTESFILSYSYVQFQYCMELLINTCILMFSLSYLHFLRIKNAVLRGSVIFIASSIAPP